MGKWKLWQARLLGFAGAWWLAVLPTLCSRIFPVGDASWGVLPFVLPGATLLALITLAASESQAVRCLAGWFLLGVLSMALVAALAISTPLVFG